LGLRSARAFGGRGSGWGIRRPQRRPGPKTTALLSNPRRGAGALTEGELRPPIRPVEAGWVARSDRRCTPSWSWPENPAGWFRSAGESADPEGRGDADVWAQNRPFRNRAGEEVGRLSEGNQQRVNIGESGWLADPAVLPAGTSRRPLWTPAPARSGCGSSSSALSQPDPRPPPWCFSTHNVAESSATGNRVLAARPTGKLPVHRHAVGAGAERSGGDPRDLEGGPGGISCTSTAH